MHSEEDGPRSPQMLPPPSPVGSAEHEEPELHGFRRRWAFPIRDSQAEERVGSRDCIDLELPEIDLDEFLEPINQPMPTPALNAAPGVTCSRTDAETLVTHSFISNMKFTDISMPWEKGPMKSIFGDDDQPYQCQAVGTSLISAAHPANHRKSRHLRLDQ